MRAPPSRFKVGLRMLGLGVLFGWASIYLIPTLTRHGITERTANRLPFAAFAAGLALGLASAISKTTQDFVFLVWAVPLTGGVFWFFGVLLGGLLVACGVPSEAADYVPVIAFGLGAALALLPGAVVGREAVSAFFARRSRRGRDER
jgi:hypothetical protein